MAGVLAQPTRIVEIMRPITIALKFLIIFTLLIIHAAAYALTVPPFRPNPDEYCFDFAGILPAQVIQKVNEQGRSLTRNFDVDFMVLVVPDLQGRDIIEYTADLFSRWQIGKSTKGKKGILILIAWQEQKVKIEIGYDLEGIYTDAYVGQVEREILKEFLEQADWEKGFLATIENFLFRIFNKDMAEEVRETSSQARDLDHFSQGAGATNVFDFGAALNKPLPENYDELKKYFSAQPTPELAFLRYMELQAKAVQHNNDLTLFTYLSNDFWKKWTHTSGQSRAEAEHISGRPYIIKQKDNHAVVFFPHEKAEDLKKSPMYYLFKSDQGWQVDINTMTRGMRCVGPGWWMVTDIFVPYSEIIIDEYNLANGFLTRWDDPGGYFNYFILDTPLYDNREPGFHIGVFYDERSNLKRGDAVLAVNGEKIRDFNHLFSFLKNVPAGTSYSIDILRDGKPMTVTETVPGYPDGFEKFRPCLKTPRMWLGVYMVQSLDKEWRETLKMRDRGIFRYSCLCSILEVYPGSPADNAGLKPNDLIMDYGMDDDNGEVMPWDVIQCLQKTKPGDSIEFTILRDMKHKMKIKVTPEETRHQGYF